MKLGLKIEITNEGAGSAAKTLNSTPALEKYASASRSFIKDVFPAREDLLLKGKDPSFSLDESERSVIFLRFLGSQGYLICIFQARPENSGRPYDGAAAWIHIPASAILSGTETVQLIDDVEAALSNAKGIDYMRLEGIFEKEYQAHNYTPIIASIGSNGNSYAVRYYGKGTDYQLNELLGDCIAQPDYAKHKAVFFLRSSEQIAFSCQVINTPLKPTCIITPPDSNDGFFPYFVDGEPFASPIQVLIGTRIKIVWKKQGFQDIHKEFDATANAKMVNTANKIEQEEIKFAVLKQWFKVHSNGKPLDSYIISIDNKNMTANELYLPMNKKDVAVRIEVRSNGYKPFQKNMRLDPQMNIPMERIMNHYEFSIPMYDGRDLISNGKVIIETNKELMKSPIKGYSVMYNNGIREGEGNINELHRDGLMENLKYYAYGFLTCICLILLCSLWLFIEEVDDIKFKSGFPPIEFVMHSHSTTSSSWNKSIQVQSQASDEKSQVKNEKEINIKEMGIAYLNSNETWCKDSIDKYPSLKGLFEDLNQYNFDNILNKWVGELKDVPNFKKIIEVVNLAKDREWKPGKGKHAPNYNTSDDNKIKLDNYVNWISLDQTEKNNVKKDKSSGSPIKSGASKLSNIKESETKKPRGGIE